MLNRSLVVALMLSLMLNLAVVAGYAYERYAAGKGQRLDEVAAALQLSANERAALVEMRRAVFAGVRDLRQASTQPNAQLRRLLATSGADDPVLAAALARIGDERSRIQRDAIARLIAFRDGLSPQAQQRFRVAIERRGFLLALFGASSWGLPQAEE